jgi:hypothetical protein
MFLSGKSMFYQFRLYQFIQAVILDQISSLANNILVIIGMMMGMSILMIILTIILGIGFM